MSGSISPMHDLCDLAHEYNALTFVDEVHAVGKCIDSFAALCVRWVLVYPSVDPNGFCFVGMYGRTGAGVGEMYNCMHKFDIISGTLAKAYGVVGGYVAGKKELIDTVRSYAPGFIFTTSLPPMICAAAQKSIQILKESGHLREQQQQAASELKATLRRVGIPFLDNRSHIIPVLVGNAKTCKAVRSTVIFLSARHRTLYEVIRPDMIINWPILFCLVSRFLMSSSMTMAFTYNPSTTQLSPLELSGCASPQAHSTPRKWWLSSSTH
jgi:5-aminolevulinate synthase